MHDMTRLLRYACQHLTELHPQTPWAYRYALGDMLGQSPSDLKQVWQTILLACLPQCGKAIEGKRDRGRAMAQRDSSGIFFRHINMRHARSSHPFAVVNSGKGLPNAAGRAAQFIRGRFIDRADGRGRAGVAVEIAHGSCLTRKAKRHVAADLAAAGEA